MLSGTDNLIMNKVFANTLIQQKTRILVTPVEAILQNGRPHLSTCQHFSF